MLTFRPNEGEGSDWTLYDRLVNIYCRALSLSTCLLGFYVSSWLMIKWLLLLQAVHSRLLPGMGVEWRVMGFSGRAFFLYLVWLHNAPDCKWLVCLKNWTPWPLLDVCFHVSLVLDTFLIVFNSNYVLKNSVRIYTGDIYLIHKMLLHLIVCENVQDGIFVFSILYTVFWIKQCCDCISL